MTAFHPYAYYPGHHHHSPKFPWLALTVLTTTLACTASIHSTHCKKNELSKMKIWTCYSVLKLFSSLDKIPIWHDFQGLSWHGSCLHLQLHVWSPHHEEARETVSQFFWESKAFHLESASMFFLLPTVLISPLLLITSSHPSG